MKRIVARIAIVATIATALLAFACSNPSIGSTVATPNEGSAGSLTISIAGRMSRDLAPSLSMVPKSYVVTGSGPSGATFATTIDGASSATVSELAPGPWSVSVEAKNAAGDFIGIGVGETTVATEASAALSITVKPYDGVGSLSLSLSWSTAELSSPAVEASLVPDGAGSARTLAFALAGGSASFSAADIATGYYTLVLRLKDSGNVVAGAAEVVRIVKGQATSGTYTFDKFARISGSLALAVGADMAEPLVVGISGAATTKSVDDTLALVAVLDKPDATVVYAWYVNGCASGTGPNLSFGSGYSVGYYRVDLGAKSADGKRAGGASATIQVVASGAAKSIDGIAVNLSTDSLTPGRTAPEAASYAVSAISTSSIACAAAPLGFAAGDRAILICMRGASGKTSSVGAYELLTVQSVDANGLSFTAPIAGTYGQSSNADLGGMAVVVQRVPSFGELELKNGASLGVDAWNGATGGLLALEATTEIRLSGGSAISVAGKGYRGGVALASTWSGFQGESVCGLGQNLASANSGGGGGGGATRDGAEGGGGGGYGLYGASGLSPFAFGSGACGAGGAQYASTSARLFLGSGGGSGGHADYEYTLASGGAGGGIILLVTPSLKVSADSAVTARGGNGGTKSWRGGGGGGGSGGTVLVVGDADPLVLDAVDVSGGLHVGEGEDTFTSGKYGGRGGDGGAGTKYNK
jgi:hypothetical protein